MDLISKKDLLELTGISYGQLYRWKREKLIPEEWFIKQSSYTGQETFFPRDQIVSRVKAIMELKDEYSLEALSKMLVPEASACILREDMDLIEEVDVKVLNIALSLTGKESFRILDVAFLSLATRTGEKAGFSEQQMEDFIRRSLPVVVELKNADVLCTVFSAGDEYHVAFSREDGFLAMDQGVQIFERISVSEMVSKVNVKYNNLFH